MTVAATVGDALVGSFTSEKLRVCLEDSKECVSGGELATLGYARYGWIGPSVGTSVSTDVVDTSHPPNKLSSCKSVIRVQIDNKQKHSQM